jgi:hypothetical protein
MRFSVVQQRFLESSWFLEDSGEILESSGSSDIGEVSLDPVEIFRLKRVFSGYNGDYTGLRTILGPVAKFSVSVDLPGAFRMTREYEASIQQRGSERSKLDV